MKVLPATLGHEAQGSSYSFRRQLLPRQTQWGGPTISCSSLSQEQWSALASSPDLSRLRKGGCVREEGSGRKRGAKSSNSGLLRSGPARPLLRTLGLMNGSGRRWGRGGGPGAASAQPPIRLHWMQKGRGGIRGGGSRCHVGYPCGDSHWPGVATDWAICVCSLAAARPAE